jgi:MarR family 2-MHQ and catechol resistance regulon transcriptional repressor
MRAHNAVSSFAHTLITSFDLQPSQFGILETLYHLGSMQQHELAAKLLQTPGNITRVIDSLEQQDLVARESEPGDRRCHRIALTEKGKRRISAIFPRFATAIHNLFSKLSAKEQKQLNELLRKLGKNAALSFNQSDKKPKIQKIRRSSK